MSDPALAFDDLVAAHRTRLRGWIRARVRDQALADDIEQETWIEVLKHRETFDPARGKFWTFVLIWAPHVVRRHRGGTAAGNDEIEVVDPRPRQEVRLELARVARELLRRALSCARPPHEIVAFGFTKLGWKPAEIAAQLLDEPLAVLVARLEAELAELLPRTAVRDAFAPLHERLPALVSALIADPRTRRTYEGVLDRPAATTTLRDYMPAGDDPRELIVRWWDYVKRRVLTDLVQESTGDLLEWLVTNDPSLARRLGQKGR